MTRRSRRLLTTTTLELGAAIAAGVGMMAAACWLLETFGGAL